MPQSANVPDALLKLPEVARRVGLGRSAIYSRLQTDSQFPRPVLLSRRAARWSESEVNNWVAQQLAARQMQNAA